MVRGDDNAMKTLPFAFAAKQSIGVAQNSD
jgi:hypothetical protein